MAVIRKPIASGRLDIGGGTVPSFDKSGGVFGSIKGVADTLTRVGVSLKAEYDNQFLVEAQTSADAQWNKEYFKRTEDSPSNGKDFNKDIMGDFDKYTIEQLNAAPNADTKKALANSFTLLRADLDNKSFRFQQQRLKQTTLNNLDDVNTTNANLVYDNPEDHAFYLKRSFDAVDIANIPDVDKVRVKDIIKKSLDAARVRRDVDTDPRGAYKRLGGTNAKRPPAAIAKIISRTVANVGGVSSNYLTTLSGRESDHGRNTVSKTSSAGGLFQFIDKTWISHVKKYGSAFGLDVKNMSNANILTLKNNEALNAGMAAIFGSNNKRHMEKSLGREVTDGELAIGHFMGAGGGSKFLRAWQQNPNANAAAAFPASAKANHNVFFNKNGSSKTMQQVYNERVRPYDGRGGGQVADVYKNLPLDQRLSMQGKAGASANNLARQESQAQSNLYAQTKHDLEVGIQGNIVTLADVDQAYGRNLISGSDHVTLRGKAIKQSEQLVGDKNFASEMETVLKGGSAPISGDDKSGIKSLNNYVTASDLDGNSLNNKAIQGDPSAANQLADIVTGTTVFPSSTVNALKAAGLSTDADQRDKAYQTFSIINGKAHEVVRLTSGMKSFADDAKTYQSLLAKGFTRDQALERLDEMKTPEFRKLSDIRKSEANAIAKDSIDQSLVSEALAPTFFLGMAGGATFGGNQNVADVAVQDYKDLFKFHYTKTGDDAVAHNLTKQEMNRTWGVSTATGNDVSMLRPPENFYPHVTGYEGGSQQYIQDQLNEDVAAAAKDNGHEIGNIIIQSSVQTLDDISGTSSGIPNSGGLGQVNTVTKARQPRYTVGYTTEINGIPQIVTLQDQWFADVQKAKDVVAKETAIVAEDSIQDARKRNLRETQGLLRDKEGKQIGRFKSAEAFIAESPDVKAKIEAIEQQEAEIKEERRFEGIDLKAEGKIRITEINREISQLKKRGKSFVSSSSKILALENELSEIESTIRGDE